MWKNRVYEEMVSRFVDTFYESSYVLCKQSTNKLTRGKERLAGLVRSTSRERQK